MGVFASVANYTFGPKLLARMSTPLTKPWITTKQTRMSPVISSFQVDRLQATNYLAGVSDFEGR
jgi:hypothetical protein